ncbi:DUF3307 domain-containing protein [Tabrizicola flagellatus]|uniref:DUF3307 domain-containing protein n=1 Tax=Tabrizicola flagellatus TaxID=2593021 RepID=UPI0011F33CA9|nr:DUF3307 domain-containing protein [Tabrizicola flagellatus]
MTETLIALLFAHTLADFAFQTGWMVANKHTPFALGLHGAVVLATAFAATGTLHPALLMLALVHIAIDVGKLILTRTGATAGGLAPFLIDQALHLASLIALAFWLPGLWAGGLWAPGAIVTGDDGGILGTGLWSEAAPLPVGHLPALMVLATGFILATRAGGFAVGLLMRPFAANLPGNTAAEGLPGAGRMIRLLERGLIFVLVLIGQPQGVGLLMAAKSILRYGALKEDRELSEYVIIGTLASFGWALVVSYATLAGLAALPPLGILPATP